MTSDIENTTTPDRNGNTSSTSFWWTAAFWFLFICWVVGAGLHMYRVPGGFLTNYLADLTFPPWFYIYLRGLRKGPGHQVRFVYFGDWFGRTPERAALSIFVVGLVTELKTYYWPGGPITGTFDIWDIAAYAIGLLVSVYFEKRSEAHGPA